MNVYDFDKTIYDGDSTVDFYLYCLKKRPLLILLAPAHLSGFIGYFAGYRSKTKAKERFYRFLRYLPDTEAAVRLFWEKNISGVKDWYMKQKREDDLIISASPGFLIGEACRRLGVRSIASPVDPKSGKYSGENCHGEEKVKRFNQEYPGETIEAFYSDSGSDAPLAKKAEKAYLVNKNEIKKWED